MSDQYPGMKDDTHMHCADEVASLERRVAELEEEREAVVDELARMNLREDAEHDLEALVVSLRDTQHRLHRRLETAERERDEARAALAKAVELLRTEEFVADDECIGGYLNMTWTCADVELRLRCWPCRVRALLREIEETE